ncbi:MAG: TetR/AcrR family transcriptional regulator [Cyanobacteria bacterium SID2]|nr:TetR/AcrR family transcriptional regulator [Cyanobacteria bacterium SID2]MBP0005520.1 TetR/AcrR family transcriptional regulator [Cyanobacteria bacterium SBC]
MARHKEFDRQEALEKAMEVFWRYGYEGTSIRDLIGHMGIHRGSLYDTFGDKRSLFSEALNCYDRVVVSTAVECLETPEASLSSITRFFERIVEISILDRDRKGCFLVNSAVEVCPHDPELAKLIAANFEKIERSFLKALKKAEAKGEISQDRDLKVLAKYLTSSLQGLRVTAKIHPDRKTLSQIARSIVEGIRKPQESSVRRE